jgi:hypothetical protein
VGWYLAGYLSRRRGDRNWIPALGETQNRQNTKVYELEPEPVAEEDTKGPGPGEGMIGVLVGDTEAEEGCLYNVFSVNEEVGIWILEVGGMDSGLVRCGGGSGRLGEVVLGGEGVEADVITFC